MRLLMKAGIVASALVLGLGALAPSASSAFAQATAPARCDWLGTATAAPASLATSQVLLRLKVDQDLANPGAVHGDEDTVQFNYLDGASMLSRYDIKAGTGMHVSGFVRQGAQCVVDTLAPLPPL